MAGSPGVDLRRSGAPMIAVDTNILVYAHRRESRLGEEAHAIMTALAEVIDSGRSHGRAATSFSAS